MPLYEYKCSKCGYLFEVLVRSDAKAPPACPDCGSQDPVKQLSTFAVNHASPGCPSGASMPPCGSCRASGSCPYAED